MSWSHSNGYEITASHIQNFIQNLRYCTISIYKLRSYSLDACEQGVKRALVDIKNLGCPRLKGILNNESAKSILKYSGVSLKIVIPALKASIIRLYVQPCANSGTAVTTTPGASVGVLSCIEAIFHYFKFQALLCVHSNSL